MTKNAPRRLLLAGGGHSHCEVLRRFAAQRPRAGIVVVSPHRHLLYSGMLPGVLAGHYVREDAQIDVAALAARAGGSFVTDAVVALDLGARRAHLQGGASIPFDTLSLDVGAVPAPLPIVSAMTSPANRHVQRVLPVKPAERLLHAWPEWEADVRDGAVRSIAVIGGGAGGVEILLAMQQRLARHGLAAAFTLVSDRWSLPSALERRLVRVLRAKEVRVVIGSAVASVRGDAITLESGATLHADRMIAATGASAPPWLRASGVACDAAGFVQVDATLRSVSHPFVLASGDCATIVGAPRPKAGVFPVRQAPFLAHNLRAAIEGTRLRRYRAQRDWLVIVTTGPRHAVATRNGFAIAGAWVWRWKDRIDRAFVARYRAPASDAPRTGG